MAGGKKRGRDAGGVAGAVPAGTGPNSEPLPPAATHRKGVEIISDPNDPRIKPNYDRDCDNCGSTPIVPITGLCGPCTFGEAETADGNW